jgi:RNA polymerase sigma factor (sigma-70 family)
MTREEKEKIQADNIKMIKIWQNNPTNEEKTKVMEYFWDKYNKMIYQFVNEYYLRRGGYDYSERDDRVNDLFLVMVKCLDKYDINSKSYFFSYMYSSFINERNLSMRLFENGKGRTISNGGLDTLNIILNDDRPINEKEFFDKYDYEEELDEDVLRNLNKAQKEVLEMTMKGITQSEMCKILGVTQGYISQVFKEVKGIVKFNIRKWGV